MKSHNIKLKTKKWIIFTTLEDELNDEEIAMCIFEQFYSRL